MHKPVRLALALALGIHGGERGERGERDERDERDEHDIGHVEHVEGPDELAQPVEQLEAAVERFRCGQPAEPRRRSSGAR
ncbi:MAG: hypothetical protein JO362_09650, partial [Streptomycetaceae bacterium]|nr:hypothetical protein [Streptomycetaceae bacterium]